MVEALFETRLRSNAAVIYYRGAVVGYVEQPPIAEYLVEAGNALSGLPTEVIQAVGFERQYIAETANYVTELADKASVISQSVLNQDEQAVRSGVINLTALSINWLAQADKAIIIPPEDYLLQMLALLGTIVRGLQSDVIDARPDIVRFRDLVQQVLSHLELVQLEHDASGTFV